jgi:hypothetical protein
MNHLQNAAYWKMAAETRNTRPMLHDRAATAIEAASALGLRFCEIPFENVDGDVAELFLRDLDGRGFTFTHDYQQKGPTQRNLQIVRIEW